jgi:adenine-specific DNA methylase
MYLEEITCPLAVDVDDDDILGILSSLLHKMDKYCNTVGLIMSNYYKAYNK